jgi:hypothetical protein
MTTLYYRIKESYPLLYLSPMDKKYGVKYGEITTFRKLNEGDTVYVFLQDSKVILLIKFSDYIDIKYNSISLNIYTTTIEKEDYPQ